MIDFRKETKETPAGILQPNFRINSNEVNITLTGDVFTVNVGCQHPKVNKENIEQMLFEAKGGRKAQEKIKIIVAKGSTKVINSIKSVPIYMDEGADYWISKNKKIYAKDGYEVVEKEFLLDNDFFTQYDTGGLRLAAGYAVNVTETKNVIHILTVIQDYYASEL